MKIIIQTIIIFVSCGFGWFIDVHLNYKNSEMNYAILKGKKVLFLEADNKRIEPTTKDVDHP